MRRKLGVMITSLLMCAALSTISIGAAAIPQGEPAGTQTEVVETADTEEPEAGQTVNEEPETTAPDEGDLTAAQAEMTEQESPVLDAEETEDEFSDEAFRRKYIALASEEAYEREINAVSSTGSEIGAEAYAQKYLILGDSTSVDFCDVVSWATQLKGLRPSYINCRAVGGASYTSYRASNVISQMNEVTLTDYDAVFMLFGANDYVVCADPGAVTDSKQTTVCGALNMAINRCDNAHVKCYVILPFPIEHQFTGHTNDVGESYLTYVGAIQRLCKYRNVETINFTSLFGINAGNFSEYYYDKFHPNNALHKMAADYINSYLGADAGADEGVRAFVERLYQLCLLRPSDAEGMEYWKSRLSAGTITGSKAAEGFFFSKEFQAYQYSDEQYVELLYNTMLDRLSDAAGKKYWVDMLEAGVSRKGVFKGFADSREFEEICLSYGIKKGTCTVTEPRDKNPNLTRFVSRLYLKALGRSYDVDGLNYWCNDILTKNHDITYVSTIGFFHSKEFLGKGLSDEAYIQVLYWTFLDRPYDQQGYDYWINKMNNGMTRDEVLKGFSYSKEFLDIQKSFGL